MQESLILSVETATPGGSIAVLRGTTVLAKWHSVESFPHSNALLGEIEKVLQGASLEIKDLNLLAVVVGPGSFTGLRVGLATVKGLSTALQIPALGIPTLEAVAYDAKRSGTNCVVIPAGRTEFFAQNFHLDEKEFFRPVDELKHGKLIDILEETQKTDLLHWVVTREAETLINEFAANEKLSRWTVALVPENIALCAGQIAFARQFEGELLLADSLQIIYGRDANIRRKKTFENKAEECNG
jgi:tRNA threonylcarbamoyl adenosine modification protein YeaZ